MIKESYCVVNVIEHVNNVMIKRILVVLNAILVELYFEINAHAILLLTMMR